MAGIKSITKYRKGELMELILERDQAPAVQPEPQSAPQTPAITPTPAPETPVQTQEANAPEPQEPLSSVSASSAAPAESATETEIDSTPPASEFRPAGVRPAPGQPIPPEHPGPPIPPGPPGPPYQTEDGRPLCPLKTDTTAPIRGVTVRATQHTPIPPIITIMAVRAVISPGRTVISPAQTAITQGGLCPAG